MLVYTLASLLSLHVAWALLLYDPCSPSTSVTLDEDRALVINGTCSNGRIAWHYPRGHLTLHFTGLTSGQSVCVSPSYTRDVIATVGGKALSLEMPEEHEPACVLSSGQDVYLRLQAPSILYYMDNIQYTVS